MNLFFLYIAIFLAKVIENALGTLRLIVVANGKKILGATLNGIIAILWVATTGIVVKDIQKDPFKIIVFALGSALGSYIGSLIEQKMALGNNMLITITKKEGAKKVMEEIRKMGYGVTSIDGEGKEEGKKILLIMVSRKKRKEVVLKIKEMDCMAIIIAENAFTIQSKTYPN